MKEAVRRTATFVGELMRKTGCSEEDCGRPFPLPGEICSGRKNSAARDLSGDGGGEPSLFREDLRYRALATDLNPIQCRSFAMLDVSGSMETMQKYLARSFFFWLVEFLRQIYHRVRSALLPTPSQTGG